MTMHEAAVAVAVIGCAFDLRTRRIPNALTLPASLAGVAAGAALGGLAGASASVAGFATGILLFLPFFLLRGMGGGDVKLLGAIGAWVGPALVLDVALWSAMAGGALALGIVLLRVSGRRVLRNLRRLVAHWIRGGLRPHPELTLERAAGPRLAYALPMTAGLMVSLWLR